MTCAFERVSLNKVRNKPVPAIFKGCEIGTSVTADL
jgi:hypothetical protein